MTVTVKDSNTEEHQRVIETAKKYYDSEDAFNFYKQIWGGDLIHVGLYDEVITKEFPEPSVPQIRAAAQHSLETLLSLLPEGYLNSSSVVADFGAAYGGSARYIAKHYGCHVNCIDISSKENECNARLTEEQNMNHLITIIEASFTQVPLPACSQDFVKSQDSIGHAGDLRPTVVSEAARILKPGGYFLFTDLMQADDAKAEDLKDVYARIQLDSMPSVAEYKESARKAGLEFVKFVDASPMLGNHYNTVATVLRSKLNQLEDMNIDRKYADKMLSGLDKWVHASRTNKLRWGYCLFQKPE